MTAELERLAEHRDALLLAELAGWLHDWRKCSDEHVLLNSADPPKVQGLSAKHIKDWAPPLSEAALVLLGASLSLLDLSEAGRRGRPNAPGLAVPVAYLRRSHGAAHIEKEEPGDETARDQFNDAGKQRPMEARASTPFGFETHLLMGLTSRLREALGRATGQPGRDKSLLAEAFALATADTRRPINEVSLSDWSGLVAALYKAALAGALLGFQPPATELRWRLLSVRFDGLGFISAANRLPDVIARREVLREALERVRKLIEEEYPLGAEVYRDEDGSVFVVPGFTLEGPHLDLMHCTDKQGATLEVLLRSAVRGDDIEAVQRGMLPDDIAARDTRKAGDDTRPLRGEMVPRIMLDDTPWWAQDPQRQLGGRASEIDDATKPPAPRSLVEAARDEMPQLVRHLEPVVRSSDPAWLDGVWGSRSADLCPVCKLRPQASPRSSAGRLRLCEVCAGRRAHRARDWSRRLSTTIWTDEVADHNARLALLVGRFDLGPWLDGTMVKTLLVTDPACGTVEPKNPSFARLRRIWETTRRFWQEVLPAEGTDPGASLCGQLLMPVEGRLVIRPANLEALGLQPWHAYDLVLGAARLSVLCREHDLISLDNLRYVARQLSVRDLKRYLMEQDQVAVEEPVGYGSPNRVVGRLVIAAVDEEPTRYVPAIPILAEPRTFMALLPADSALRVAQAIAGKYAQEMGKVRNRLALTLGLVYFGRRLPLAAALEAGRAMLERRCEACEARVRSVEPLQTDDTAWPAAVRLRLAVGEREVSLEVPTVMGDGRTPDAWYPYWRLLAPAEGPRGREFAGPDGGRWVHVTDLRAGDTVQLVPSTFDYEYLDVAARRYEVAYEGLQRRSADRFHRPYLLEELADLERVWQLAGPPEAMARSQVGDLVALIEGRRAAWGLPRGEQALRLNPDHPFTTLCREALANADWRRGSWKALAGEDRQLLQRAALSGMLADVLELHLTLAREAKD